MVHLDESGKLAQKMTDAYMSQNLELLDAVMHEKLGNAYDALPEENERLIYGRNQNWSQQMPAIMQVHSTLFAVGGGHLPGERGVLRLLQKQGYSVEAVR